ncbi:FMN-dependent NADH-azoreductase [Pseudomonas sp. LTJR-52]|uniref:FMN-dependent NADH-azoreductase n=1 Tax=Pseudomonas sp. LTJR-52 TaxID=2479392 RepID=UPI000EFD9ED9|nr:NAD(P)H-dependent oxidoreductase [Pseudomonas sp. LTJR-52]AYN96245.1 FMN-dependent NADH-azoreductase [Pseudomonas sp. LTJR-52]
MRDILLISASARTAQSLGYGLARELIEIIQRDQEDMSTTCRVLIEDGLSPLTCDYEIALTQHTPKDDPVFKRSEVLIKELECSNLLIIATPIHNFTVPASLKLWIDQVVRIGRTFEARPEGKVGLLKDRPVYIIVSSGGFHQGSWARQPDFLSPYLRHVLNTIGLFDVHFIYLEGLASGADTAREALTSARQQLAREPLFHTLASSPIEN